MRKLSCAVVVLALLLIGCASSLVGQIVAPYKPDWCLVNYTFPTSCAVNLQHFEIPFRVDRVAGEPDTYMVEGALDATKGELRSWTRVLMWQSSFRMLVVSHGRVVEDISFMPRREELSQPLPFMVKFRTDKEIEAIGFKYDIKMQQ